MSLKALRFLSQPPRNLHDVFLRSLAALFVSSRVARHSLLTLRPDCKFSPEITDGIDELADISREGECCLRAPLNEANLILPAAPVGGGAGILAASFLTRLPAGTPSELLAKEIFLNLRQLAQHLELKTQLLAEEALVLGHDSLHHALLSWADKWQASGRALHRASIRARTQAYVADVAERAVPQSV